MDKSKSLDRMLSLANRLNEIVEEMKARRDALLAEQTAKAA
ncbi:TPA: hypothetical protein ACN76M_001997 [Klebsiella pneumoniae]|nr:MULTISPECIES: hypothetical protein [Klebsiella]ASC23271.1 hypothetical protein AM386_16255 [Klebsiella pneumoniae]MDE4748679.1 hypothetical protein [Klebsiella pneumoniae]MDG3488237.1 hypothetical protein [Klebsiella pneumoniae]MDY2356929.1 hypothetical protein [Klebsiella pneumoniae]MEA4357534.1 hypothetical protein [Klebsiella pneumoniae]